MNNLGLYIHIPFCKRKCNYCDFYSITDLALTSDYVRALQAELIEKSKDCTGVTVDTVYFGGGTPSLLSCKEFGALIGTVKEYYDISPDAEITVEVNPSSLDSDKALCYRSLGVNRVSIGMQSACDSELCMLGRLHDASTFDAAYTLLRKVGFKNISIDLMYALPEQSVSDVDLSLDHVIALSPEHISAYCLKIEQGTHFYAQGIAGADDDDAYAQYAHICDRLEHAGYRRYEMSNFAKNGLISRHNVKYWTGADYLGFGPAAYSLFNGKRGGISADIYDYLSGVSSVVDEEILDVDERERESIMLGLRLAEGVELHKLDADKVKLFSDNGYMEFDNERAWLTTKGFFVSNSIISEFLD